MSRPAVLLAGSSDLAEPLSDLLNAQVRTWARELDPDLHGAPPGADLAAELQRIGATREGPMLVIWPGVARLRSEHGQAAVDDLDAGCDVVFGPLVDGGLYMLGFQHPTPLVLDLLGKARETDATADALAAAAQAGLEIGYLRPERGLASPDGVALALADPLTPGAIRALLPGG